MGSSSVIPPPPPGFIPIEQAQGAIPPPPAGFVPIESLQSSAPGAQAGKEDSGFLSKAWKALNTPVADLLGGDGMTKRALLQAVGQHLGLDLSPENLEYQMHRTDTNHPAVQGLRTFLAGSLGDTADTAAGLTSPVSIGTAAIGTAAKGAGAAAKVAKAVAPMVGAGFAAKGAKDVAQNAGAAIQGDPDAAQRALMGGAMMAGGAAGAGEGMKQLPGAEDLAARMYQSAIKPPPGSYSNAEVKNIVQTGLKNEIPVSQEGAAKLDNLISDYNSKVKDAISAGARNGATVNKFAVASRLSDTANKFATQVTPESDLSAVSNAGQEFIRNQPGNIPVNAAQDLKSGTYQQLKGKNFGELKSASIEAQKALARGIKEELETQFPEIKDLNASQSKLLDLDGVLDRALNRTQNRDIFSLGGKIAAGSGAAIGAAFGAEGAGVGTLASLYLHHVMSDPMVQSRLAIALSKAGKGMPYAPAKLRVASYVTALANAASQRADDHGNGAPQE